MPARTRPLSPHLQIYRWQIGNSLSILHRLTGLALSLGLLALSYWLIALAGGEQTYRTAAQNLFRSDRIDRTHRLDICIPAIIC